MLILYKKYYLCIVDYHSNFQVIKMTGHLLGDCLILLCQGLFSEYGLHKRIMSDADGNFVSENSRTSTGM